MPKNNKKKSQEKNTLVVGIGASAGGLEVLQKFFKSLPEQPNMAFVVVVHLSPDKKSHLTQILQRETSLKIHQVRERTPIKENHVYVIPPDNLLSVEDNYLALSGSEKKHGIASIDHLFRTLGRKKQKYSAGIIFSGSGSDGTSGMKIIKEEGGITIAQAPDEAQFSSMPASVIQTGVVDKVLPVEDIAKELNEYREVLYQIQISEEAEKLSKEEKTEKILTQLFEKIRTRNNHDFSNYRRSSMLRRVDRRMRLNRVQTLSAYLDFLDEHPGEIDNLYKDFLIGVTNFFRNSEAFNGLEEKVIPKLFENNKAGEQLRIWVAGCATGEEAYSIAILAEEYASTLEKPPEIQIFASDVDQKALNEARTGRYPKSIKNDISKERLKRFFKEDGDEYLVKEKLKNMILFTSHDMLRNPPFSRLDLITCRNLLIYLNRDLQVEVLNLFHYALRKNGWLFLGESDSRLGMEDLFTPISKKFRIYRQKTSSSSQFSLPKLPLLNKTKPVSDYQVGDQRSAANHEYNLEKIHWSILARFYAPQSVLISEDYEVIHSTKGIEKFLQYSGGEPSKNILKMVSPQIRQNLRNLLFQLKKEDSLSAQKKFWVKTNDESNNLELIARRVANTDFPEGLIHVVFQEIPEEKKKSKTKQKKDGINSAEEEADIIHSLEKELEHTRKQLQLSIEEYETSNEELRASNEELQSANQVLQSTTEELQTSQEEMHSLNEELRTVNDQLETKVEELSRAHSDLENLMETTEIGIIFVNRDLCVQRFTSAASDIFNLIKSDKDRPLQHITHSLEYDGLIDDLGQVLDHLEQVKRVVKTKDNRWYIMRLRPYRSLEDKIEGVVLSFTEFTELKTARETIEEQTFQETLATLGVYALEQEDLNMILHRAIQQICAILDLKCAVILKLNEEQTTLEVLEEAGCGWENIEMETDVKWDLGYTLTSKNPVHVLDFREEKRFKISPSMEEKGMTSGTLVALRGTEQVYGVLAVYSKEKREFTKQDLHFLQVVANILGRSIEQKMNQQELMEAYEQLITEMKRSEELQKDLLDSNILERWELGGYLHDNFGQLLASVKILADDIRIKASSHEVDILDEVAEINKIMNICISDIRDVIHDIIPIDIEQEGVAQAFRVVMNQTFKMYDVRCVLENDEILNEIKNRKAATHLYHIVQEAFKNAAIHGKADLIVLSPKKEGDDFVLTIKDDGVGLETNKDGKGKGIRIMEHRMDLLEGTFEIEEYSENGLSGTVITCTMPVDKLKRDN